MVVKSPNPPSRSSKAGGPGAYSHDPGTHCPTPNGETSAGSRNPCRNHASRSCSLARCVLHASSQSPERCTAKENKNSSSNRSTRDHRKAAAVIQSMTKEENRMPPKQHKVRVRRARVQNSRSSRRGQSRQSAAEAAKQSRFSPTRLKVERIS